MISAVFDCMVFLQATTSRTGPGAACLEFVEQGRVRLFLSTEILAEVRRVFLRRSTQEQFPDLTEAKVEMFLAKLTALGDVRDTVPPTQKLPRDPKDEPYLNLAVATRASFIVSWDSDLLSLMEQTAFRKNYASLAIVDPPTFLRHVRSTFGRQ